MTCQVSTTTYRYILILDHNDLIKTFCSALFQEIFSCRRETLEQANSKSEKSRNGKVVINILQKIARTNCISSIEIPSMRMIFLIMSGGRKFNVSWSLAALSFVDLRRVELQPITICASDSKKSMK